MRINRLELIKAELGLENARSFSEIEDVISGQLTDRALAEYRRQAGILGETVPSPETLLNRAKAAAGGSYENATWSQRLWNISDAFRDNLATTLQNAIIQGLNPETIGRWAQNFLRDKGLAQARNNINRLMRTELARVQEEVQKDSYKRNGFEQFVFIALMEGPGAAHTCKVCKGLDGQTFPVKMMMPGENAPPMHPNCRCSTAAWMDREVVERELFGGPAFSSITHATSDYDESAVFDIKIDGITKETKELTDR